MELVSQESPMFKILDARTSFLFAAGPRTRPGGAKANRRTKPHKKGQSRFYLVQSRCPRRAAAFFSQMQRLAPNMLITKQRNKRPRKLVAVAVKKTILTVTMKG